jgi:predicted RNA-binding Zn-ribbon protein involved in translation (DUF1610 family)
MAGHDRQRFTIGQIMVSIACIALAIALLVNAGAARTASIIIGLLGIGFLAVVSLVAVIDVGMGIRCPNCGGWTMGRTSVASFRDRFFRCSKCGIRCRRGMLSGWEDASAPEFDRFYTRKRPENPWTAPPGLEDEDLIYSKTHVNLLLNKKRRNPNAPDQETGRKP